jgi:predicted Zn-dependent protease
LTTGIWQGLTNDDMRAFVIGHELAHVVLKHVAQTQVRRVGFALVDRYVLQRYIPAGSVLNRLDSVGLQLLDKRFSRDVEYKADDLGLQLMKQAGFNPNAALSVFRFLGAHSGGSTPEFLSSHPISESRIRNLVQRYKLNG